MSGDTTELLIEGIRNGNPLQPAHKSNPFSIVLELSSFIAVAFMISTP